MIMVINFNLLNMYAVCFYQSNSDFSIQFQVSQKCPNSCQLVELRSKLVFNALFLSEQFYWRIHETSIVLVDPARPKWTQNNGNRKEIGCISYIFFIVWLSNRVDWMTLCNKGKCKSGIFRKVKASFVNWPLIIDNGRQNRQVVKLLRQILLSRLRCLQLSLR